MASPFVSRRPVRSPARQLLGIFVTVLVVLAACLVGSLRVVQGCWLGVDCGPVIEAESVTAVVVSPDGRTLSVYGSAPCSGRDTFTATEYPDRVVVSDVWTGSAHEPGCQAAMGRQAQAVHLAAPLGNRQLIDKATGRPVRWIGGPSLLNPGYLPPGFVMEPTGEGQWPELLDDPFQSACSTRYYTSGPGPELVISECTGRLVADPPPDPTAVIGQATAAGTTVQIRAYQNVSDDGIRGLVWVAGDRSFMVATTIRGGQRLPDETLIAVADGLH